VDSACKIHILKCSVQARHILGVLPVYDHRALPPNSDDCRSMSIERKICLACLCTLQVPSSTRAHCIQMRALLPGPMDIPISVSGHEQCYLLACPSPLSYLSSDTTALEKLYNFSTLPVHQQLAQVLLSSSERHISPARTSLALTLKCQKQGNACSGGPAQCGTDARSRQAM
jgi:hypothetical protein